MWETVKVGLLGYLGIWAWLVGVDFWQSGDLSCFQCLADISYSHAFWPLDELEGWLGD